MGQGCVVRITVCDEIFGRYLQEIARVLEVVSKLAGDEPFEPQPAVGIHNISAAIIEIARR